MWEGEVKRGNGGGGGGGGGEGRKERRIEERIKK